METNFIGDHGMWVKAGLVCNYGPRFTRWRSARPQVRILPMAWQQRSTTVLTSDPASRHI